MNIFEWFEKLLDANNVWDGLHPIILFGQLGGLIPFKFNIKSQKTKISISIPFLSISFFYGLFYAYCFYMVINSNEMILSSKNYSALLRIGDYSRIYISFASMVTIGISFYYKFHSYAKIFDSYFASESLFCLIHHEIQYKKLKLEYICAIFSQNIFNLVNVILHNILMNSWAERPSIYMIIITYTPGIFFSMILLIFCAMNKFALFHLKSINEELIKILNNRSSKMSNFSIFNMEDYKKEKIIFVQSKRTIKEKTDFDKISIIWKIYDNICDTCDNINELFSFKLLVILTGSFIAIVFNLFNGLMALVELNGENLWYHSTILLIAIHHGIVFITVISIPILMCNKCLIAVKDFCKLFPNNIL